MNLKEHCSFTHGKVWSKHKIFVSLVLLPVDLLLDFLGPEDYADELFDCSVAAALALKLPQSSLDFVASTERQRLLCDGKRMTKTILQTINSFLLHP